MTIVSCCRNSRRELRSKDVIYVYLLVTQVTYATFMNRVGLELPTLEVRFQNLSVEAECEVVHGTPLPTLWNTLKNMLFVSVDVFVFGFLEMIAESEESVFNVEQVVMNSMDRSEGEKIKVLKDVSGIIKPSRYNFDLFA